MRTWMMAGEVKIVHLVEDGTEVWERPLTACSGTAFDPFDYTALPPGTRLHLCVECQKTPPFIGRARNAMVAAYEQGFADGRVDLYSPPVANHSAADSTK